MRNLNARWFAAKKSAEDKKSKRLHETDLLKERNLELEAEILRWKTKVRESIEREVYLSERIKQISSQAGHPRNHPRNNGRNYHHYHGNTSPR